MYTKLYADMLDSSIWEQPNETRIIWITMLLMADEDGMVYASPSGIMRRACLSANNSVDNPADDALAAMIATTTALDWLEAPDPASRNPDHDGRHIEAVPGGYLILNYAERRTWKSRDDQRAKTRERVRKFRESHDGVKSCNAPNPLPDSKMLQCNADVTPVTLCNAIHIHKQKHIQKQNQKQKETTSLSAETPPADVKVVLDESLETSKAGTSKRASTKTSKPESKPKGPPIWAWWCNANKEAGRPNPLRVGPDLGAARELGRLVAGGELDADKLRDAMRVYLGDKDPWLTKQGHALRHLGGRLNAYATAPVPKPAPVAPMSESIVRQKAQNLAEYLDKGGNYGVWFARQGLLPADEAAIKAALPKARADPALPVDVRKLAKAFDMAAAMSLGEEKT